MNVQIELKAPRDAWYFNPTNNKTDRDFHIAFSMVHISNNIVTYFTKNTVTNIDKRDFQLLRRYLVKIEQWAFTPLVDNWLFNSKIYFLRN